MNRRVLPLILLCLLIFFMMGCNDIARFNGNNATSDNELEFIVRRPLSNWTETKRQADLIDAAEAIRNRLDHLGYVWAEVEGEPPLANEESDQLPRFTIREGPRVRIGAMTFERVGNDSALSGLSGFLLCNSAEL